MRTTRGVAAMTAAADNLRAWRAGATADDIAAGRDWYPHAQRVARDMSRAHGAHLDTVCGVIAALSPRAPWAANLQGADEVLRAHATGADRPYALPGIYGANIAKAWRIAEHGRGFPRCDATRTGKRGGRVRCSGHAHGCAAADYLHGPKVAEFADTILGKRDGRTMDVWATRAADVAPNEALTLAADDPRREGVPGNRLAELQDAYAEVAAEFGEDARVTQAIVWTRIRRAWRRSNGTANGMWKTDDGIPF